MRSAGLLQQVRHHPVPGRRAAAAVQIHRDHTEARAAVDEQGGDAQRTGIDGEHQRRVRDVLGPRGGGRRRGPCGRRRGGGVAPGVGLVARLAAEVDADAVRDVALVEERREGGVDGGAGAGELADGRLVRDELLGDEEPELRAKVCQGWSGHGG
ncbi:hypothetical protein PWT90_00572 [Aphanocladium album]|nr:hypothetical protein PWT90_00572 [Aphanocladium album]